MQYIIFTSYQDNGGLAEIRARATLTLSHIRTILKFTLVEDTSNRLHSIMIDDGLVLICSLAFR
jgi:hypothetical protein